MSDFAAVLAKAREKAAQLGVKRPTVDEQSEAIKRQQLASRYAGLGTLQIQPAPQDKYKREFYFPKLYVGSVSAILKHVEESCPGIKTQIESHDTGDYRFLSLQGDGEIDRAKSMIDEVCHFEIGRSEGKVVESKYPVPHDKVSSMQLELSRLERASGARITVGEAVDDTRTKGHPFIVYGTPVQVSDARRLMDDACGGPANSKQLYVANERVGLVIGLDSLTLGKGGEGIKHIMGSCNVKIQIEQTPSPQGRLVTISGHDEDIENAKWMIDDKVGPQHRTRYVQEYMRKGDDNDPLSGYGFSGEDPYKHILQQQQQAGFVTYDEASYQQQYGEMTPEQYAEWYAYYYPNGLAEEEQEKQN